MMNPMTPPSPLGMRLPQFGGAPPSAGQFNQPGGAPAAPGLPAAPMGDPGSVSPLRNSLATGTAPIRPFGQIGMPGQRNPIYSPTL